MNRTQRHSFFRVEQDNFRASNTYFYHMSLSVHEGLQRVRFPTHQTIDSKNLALDTSNFS